MKHQWDLYPEAPGDVRVRCDACGTEAVVIDNMIGRAIATEECSVTWSAELVSTPMLVQLSDTEWINPQQVVSVVFRDLRERDSQTSAPDPRVCIAMDGGHGFFVKDRSLAEVVALINGDDA